MSTAYQCVSCKARSFDEGPCWNCGGDTEPYETFTAAKGMCTNIVPDSFRPYFDWSSGMKLSSHSERNAVYKKMGMTLHSAKDFARENNVSLPRPKRIYSYSK